MNTEMKYPMFRHAFEEGALRRHTLNDDGGSRDTGYFSVVDDEWPAKKARLEGMLER